MMMIWLHLGVTNCSHYEYHERGNYLTRKLEIKVCGNITTNYAYIFSFRFMFKYLGNTLIIVRVMNRVEEERSYNVMNMEDFLAENNIKMDIMQERSPEPIEVKRYSPSAFMGSPESPQSPCEIKPQPRPSIIMAPRKLIHTI